MSVEATCDMCAEQKSGCIIEPVDDCTLCPDCVKELTTGALLIAAERQRQIEVEGWTPEHDDEHDRSEMAHAAVAYLYQAAYRRRSDEVPGSYWPWDRSWWKPSDDPIRNLVKAGALIAAEIDRLQRSAS